MSIICIFQPKNNVRLLLKNISNFEVKMLKQNSSSSFFPSLSLDIFQSDGARKRFPANASHVFFFAYSMPVAFTTRTRSDEREIEH